MFALFAPTGVQTLPIFRLCTGYDGGGCGSPMGPGSYRVNITPINSITLEP